MALFVLLSTLMCCQQSWFWAFLFHKFSIFLPPVPLRQYSSSKFSSFYSPPQRVTPDILFVLFGVFGDVQRVKIMFNKRDNALVQVATEQQWFVPGFVSWQGLPYGPKKRLNFPDKFSINIDGLFRTVEALIMTVLNFGSKRQQSWRILRIYGKLSFSELKWFL